MMIKNTVPIINQIEEAVKDIPGWSSIDQLYSLFNLVYLSPDLDGDIMEIGSWCGRSAIALGMAAQLIGETNIFCIDLFPDKNDWKQNKDGSWSFSVKICDNNHEAYHEQAVWKEPFEKDIMPIYKKYNGIYQVFKESIIKSNLEDLVKIHKGTSTTFANSVQNDFRCKLAFIDGDHSYDAVRNDIHNVEKYLIEGGWICFDDAFSQYDRVDKAITDFIIKNSAYELCQQMTRKFFIARKKTGRKP